MADRYEEKRDFSLTPEPQSGALSPATGPLRFCVQKHDARRLHYDLRLEVDGTLISFAVPQGPSANPADKRLAVHTEDHPLEYLDFEAVIPEGQYGGGEMILWDKGIYSPDEDGVLVFDNPGEASRRMSEGLAKGKLSFTLRGTKLQGSWTLVKTTRAESDWLLIKHKDAFVTDRDLLTQDRSVLTGRTIEDLKAGRMAPQERDYGAISGAIRSPMAIEKEPMLCSEAPEPFDGEDWLFELKLDGIRALAFVQQHRARLYSRNAKDITDRFPEVAAELEALPYASFCIDGELVCYGASGAPNFGTLLERFQLTNAIDIRKQIAERPVEFCVFDLLHIDGWDLRNCELSERRTIIQTEMFRSAHVRLLDQYPGIGKLLFAKAKEMGFEGVVAKRRDSKYRGGRRSPNWLKMKAKSSGDFVVVGYTLAEGKRSKTFKGLILASEEEGRLIWQGNVGGGFNEGELAILRSRLDALPKASCPFEQKPELEAKPVYVEPRIVVEVEYGARTNEGRLRFPVFVRERPDLEVGPPAVEPVVVESAMDDVFEQLARAKNNDEIVVDGVPVHFTNLDRPFWPAGGSDPGVTKRDLAIYYMKVAEHVIREWNERPLSLVRCPDGIGGERFFQKHWEKGVPEFVDRVPVWSDHNDRIVDYVTCANRATLLWFAQMAILEVHPWYSRRASGPEGLPLEVRDEATMDASSLSYPDYLVVDLDPTVDKATEEQPAMADAAFAEAVEVAFKTKEMLGAIQLPCYAKTSGKTGIHIFVPIKRNLTYGQVRHLAETLGRHLEAQIPDKVTMEWVVKKRPKKVFFDHNQNVRGKTLAGLLSPRPVQGAPVSFPVPWSALATVKPSQFTVLTAPHALEINHNIWSDIGNNRVDLQRLLG